MKAELIISKSNKLKDIQNYISELSSVVRDKSPKSAEKLFDRLLTESVGEMASRVLEYIPCRITGLKNDDMIMEHVSEQNFGFFSPNFDTYYTNARELLNLGYTMKQVLKLVNFDDYAVFKCEAPYFIYGQVSTHNQLTTVSHSQRYAECDRGFWIPPEVRVYLEKSRLPISVEEKWNNIVSTFRPAELRELMKRCGVKRKEVFDRGVDMLQNRVFVIGGYTNNPNAWTHFVAQRLDKHTQHETREFTKLLNDKLWLN